MADENTAAPAVASTEQDALQLPGDGQPAPADPVVTHTDAPAPVAFTREVNSYAWGDLEIAPGFNTRNIGSKEVKAHIAWLASQFFGVRDKTGNIIEPPVGQRDPLRGYYEDGKVKLTNGECRYRAVQLGIGNGWADPAFPLVVELEPKGSTALEHTKTLLLSNSGLPLNAYEESLVFKRLRDEFGMDVESIGRLHNPPFTKQQVINYLVLADATPKMQTWIQSNTIKPTTVHQTIQHYMGKKKNLSGEELEAVLGDAEAALQQAVDAAMMLQGNVTGELAKKVIQAKKNQASNATRRGKAEDESGQGSIGLDGSVRQGKRRTAAEKEMAYEVYDKVVEAWADIVPEHRGRETVLVMPKKQYTELSKLILGDSKAGKQEDE